MLLTQMATNLIIAFLREVFTNQTKPLYPWIKKLFLQNATQTSQVYQYAFINLGKAFKLYLRIKASTIILLLIIVENQSNRNGPWFK